LAEAYLLTPLGPCPEKASILRTSTRLPQAWLTDLTWPVAVAGIATGRLVWRAAVPGWGPGVQKTPGPGEKRFRPPAQVVMAAQQRPKFEQARIVWERAQAARPI
jgi:hypothetical protein